MAKFLPEDKIKIVVYIYEAEGKATHTDTHF